MPDPSTTEPRDTQAEAITSDSVPLRQDEVICEELPAPEGNKDGDAASKDGTPAPHRPTALLLEYLELFVTCLCTIMILFAFFFRVCIVSGPSMLPTLQDGEILFVSDLFYDPAPGDIIIFHQTHEEIDRFNEAIVKRVIATEGQKVYIDFTNGYVEVDGVRLQEDYIQLVEKDAGYSIDQYQMFADHHFRMEPQADGKTHHIFEATVPEGTLFVMGDNRNDSTDSRSKIIGFVDERRVLGHVLCRMSLSDGFEPVD